MKNFLQPLSIYFVWSPANNKFVKPLIDYCLELLLRDVERPFSRSMNLPIFYRTSNSSEVPSLIEKTSQKVMIFVFLSKDIIANEAWCSYIENLPAGEDIHIIPIAMDPTAFKISGVIKNKNQIRAFDFAVDFLKEYLFISIAHEIYRWTLNETEKEIKVGKDKAIKLFISHAKDRGSGFKLATELKKTIDNSSMNNFFDAADIAQGYDFETEIINHIKDSTLISIHSDTYSSRYWCQRELISAKELNRPIIVVDTLQDFEDRRFPYAANVPGVHVHIADRLNEEDVLKILNVALLETVRFFYSQRLLTIYQEMGWFNKDAIICSRPPDISDLNNLFDVHEGAIDRKNKEIIYPEPPLYSEELMFLFRLGIEMNTPLKLLTEAINPCRVGISVSEPSEIELIEIGQASFHLIQLSQDLARYFLSNGSTIIYGGDLQKNGFTEFIFKEAEAVQGRLQEKKITVENYTAWPIYLKSTEEYIDWVADYYHIAKIYQVEYAKDITDLLIDDKTFLGPTGTKNKFVWCECLTKMRTEMIRNSEIRIFAGGRLAGFKGKMPGVLEEFMISVKEQQPIFLLGGFGGVTAALCDSILNGDLVEELSLEWQLNNNYGLKEIYEYSKERNRDYFSDYDRVANIIKNIDLKNGLSKEDNTKLYKTQFSDEAIRLVFKGLRNLKFENKIKFEV
jgi:hypothetical protein